VLHHAADPAAALSEAARVLAPHGTLVVVDLAPHGLKLGHPHAGFSRAQVTRWLTAAGMSPGRFGMVGGKLDVAIWTATRAEIAPERAALPQELFA